MVRSTLSRLATAVFGTPVLMSRRASVIWSSVSLRVHTWGGCPTRSSDDREAPPDHHCFFAFRGSGDCRAFFLDPVDDGARSARPAQASAVVRLLKVVSTNHSQLARCATAIIALMREYWRFETA